MGPPRPAGPVLCISVDAIAPGDLDRILAHPDLAGLAAKGARVRAMRTVAPSLTYPAHASILTGRPPASHGVVNNEVDPPSGYDWDWHWYRRDVRGDTAADAVKRAGYRVASILWPTMAGARLDWVLPEIAASVKRGEDLTRKALRNGTPLFLLLSEIKYGGIRRGMHQPWLDDFATALALDLLRRRRRGPDLLLLHLVDVDDAKHHAGVDAVETREACDRSAVRIRCLLEAAGPDATVLVLGDHAQIDVHGRVRIAERLAEADLPVRVHAAGAGAFLYPLEGFRTDRDGPRLEALLGAFRDEPGSGLRGWLDRAGMAAEGTGDGRAVALLDAADGFTFDEVQRATHGHLPDHPGIATTLFAAGPRIRAGAQVETGSILDVGPTLAALFGARLEGAVGKVLPILTARIPMEART